MAWSFVDDSIGFTLALPPGFEERPSGAAFRRWVLPGDYQPYMSFGVIHDDLGLSSQRRPYQPALMLDYSECTETVAGYEVSIQSWRTPNGIFHNYRRYDRYDVFAIWQVRPGLLVYLTGGAHSRAAQELMLAAMRTWRPKTR